MKASQTIIKIVNSIAFLTKNGSIGGADNPYGEVVTWSIEGFNFHRIVVRLMDMR